MNWICTLLYGLLVIWTGLLRGIDAKAYKPNSLWFCLAMGLICIAACYLYRLNRCRLAAGCAGFATAVVLLFYFYCLVSQPEKDATLRVGVIIVASIGHLALIFLPAKSSCPPSKG